MINSIQCIRIGVYKKNLEKKKNYILKIKSLHEIIKLLEVLSGNQSKFEIVNELILKARKIIDEFPSQIKNKIKILLRLEDEIEKFNNKSCENMIDELQKNITESLLHASIEILPASKINLVKI